MNATASSVDGRSFTFDAPIGSPMVPGSFVTITTGDGESLLGQVLDLAAADGGAINGDGAVLGRSPVRGFGGASIEPAAPEAVGAHIDATLGGTAGLEIGTVRGAPGVTAQLHAKGFGRHTFLCGQSGSGKTYTLGLILERLLLDTDIRVVVLDPNSDYVNLGLVRAPEDSGLPRAVHDDLAARHAAVADRIRVFGGPTAPSRLRARFGRLSFTQQTRVLGLDALTDGEEYNAFVRIARNLGAEYSLDDVLEAVQRSFDPASRQLGLRIDNLGIRDLDIWARGAEPMVDALPDDWRVLVADLGSLGSTQESSIAAAGFLSFLWDDRERRQPVIIVIDEAHNVCPQHPTDANQELATDIAVRIAGEGRKYGLYLLLSTQRPSKIHTNVLSQCDNLLLMKMNSAADLAAITETFSFAPASLVAQAPSFGLGEGLAAGKVAPDPLLFGSGRRLTVEGGTDVPSTWAQARP